LTAKIAASTILGRVQLMQPLADPHQQLIDRARIHELLYEYCARCDLNDPDGIAGCFTVDCLAFYGPRPPEHGRKARRDAAARDLALFESTSHHLSNVLIDFEGANRAVVSSYVYAWHRPRSSGPDWELWGQYHDVVVRVEDGWLIAERRLLMAGVKGFPAEWDWLRVPRHQPGLSSSAP
jgi:ketosteroid isomerase-like protein